MCLQSLSSNTAEINIVHEWEELLLSVSYDGDWLIINISLPSMSVHVFYLCALLFTIWNCCLHGCVTLASLPPWYTGNVSFSLRGITYQNNSLVTLGDIGEGNDALLCLTEQTACCRHPYTSEMRTAIGNWSFPNGTTVPSEITASGVRWNFYSTSGQMGKYMHRRRGGVTGIYSCVIPDAMNVTQIIYIGVYKASSGEW